MDPISDKGEVILDFSLYDAVMAGFKKVIFVIKKEIEEDFKKLIEGKSDKYIKTAYAYQELSDIPAGFSVPEGREKPWGTCHAVLACRDMIEGPFAVINADDYYGAGAFHTMYDYLSSAKDGELYDFSMVGYRLENTLTENGYVARGVCGVTGDGHLAEIHERTRIMRREGKIVYTEDEGQSFTEVPFGTPVSMNFWGFTESFMRELEKRFPDFLEREIPKNPLKCEYFLPLAVEELLEEKLARVRVLASGDKWYGVTYKEDKEDVVNALQSMKDKGFYPDKLWK